MISVVPAPVEFIPRSGHLSLSSDVVRRWRKGDIAVAAEVKLVTNEVLGDEGYELVVGPDGVRIHAQTRTGVLYADQTLRQLADEYHRIPCVIIRDRPRFPWRGLHLDVSRHFFSTSFIKRYLDILAFHKLNVFHWHLTDDQGWRIEIERYPRLVSIGAWRVNREHLPWNERPPQKDDESASYGGFYTQDEIKEVVAYAAERSIEVVPEIEMPAHALAALAAYPEFSCSGGPFTVAPGQYWPEIDLFCAGNENTFGFLENVLSEVAALFPGRFVHVGGDEANGIKGMQCSRCRKRMVEEGIETPRQLQGYFTRRVNRILRNLDRRLVGWDEILECGADRDAVIMSWRGAEGGIAAARRGHDVILTPASHLYFDHYQLDPATQPEAFGGYTPLSKVYSFDPIPSEITAQAETQRILGAQANLWTEYVPTASHAEYMLLPRAAALAEILWSPDAKHDWHDFESRLSLQIKRYDALGWNYCHRWE